MTVKFSVLYPKTEGATFDRDYYVKTHVPLAVSTWGLDGAEIDLGIDGPYEAAVHFTFADAGRHRCGPGLAGHGRRHGRHGELHDDPAGHPDQRDRRLSHSAQTPASDL